MSTPAYPTPPPNRASLEQRLRNICRALGVNELRTRTSLAHTVVAQMLPAGVVKGGAAIKLVCAFRITGLARSSTETSRPAGQAICDLAVLVGGDPVLGGARWAQLREPFAIVREHGPAETRVVLLRQLEKVSLVESCGLADRVDVEEVADLAARERGRGLAADRVPERQHRTYVKSDGRLLAPVDTEVDLDRLPVGRLHEQPGEQRCGSNDDDLKAAVDQCSRARLHGGREGWLAQGRRREEIDVVCRPGGDAVGADRAGASQDEASVVDRGEQHGRHPRLARVVRSHVDRLPNEFRKARLPHHSAPLGENEV